MVPLNLTRISSKYLTLLHEVVVAVKFQVEISEELAERLSVDRAKLGHSEKLGLR